MDVVADVLDAPVFDRNGRPMGRVDGILLDVAPGRAPVLSAVVIGPSALGHRIHPLIGRLIAALEQALGLSAGRPVTIGFDRRLEIYPRVVAGVAIGETGAGTIEDRLRRIVSRIPERS